MSQKLSINWRRDVPIQAMNLAFHRTDEMIRFYGRNITAMSIGVLGASCYLQGVEDCHQLMNKQKQEPIDFKI